MPTLHRLPNCAIILRTRDHRPAHVHVLMNDGREALVYLDDLSVAKRQPIRTVELAEALQWIAERTEALTRHFEELQP